MDESSMESALQFCTQWSFYNILQYNVFLVAHILHLDVDDVDDGGFTFRRIVVSGIFSLLSISLAQWKVFSFLFRQSK